MIFFTAEFAEFFSFKIKNFLSIFAISAPQAKRAVKSLKLDNNIKNEAII